MNTVLIRYIGAKSYPQNILILRRRAFQNLDLWTTEIEPLVTSIEASNPNPLDHKFTLLREEINGIKYLTVYKILKKIGSSLLKILERAFARNFPIPLLLALLFGTFYILSTLAIIST